MNDIELPGISPEPVSSYLKALGVLRLVSEQADCQARGWWQGGLFHLRTKLNVEGLKLFFLKDYSPSPVLNPWSKGSGFHPKDNTESLTAIRTSGQRRMETYQKVLALMEPLFKEVHSRTSGLKDKERKEVLLGEIRHRMPDVFLAWMDAVVVLLDDGPAYPPLFGTGGNDGRLDFSQNFMQRLVTLGLHDEKPSEFARKWLEQCLFGTVIAGLTGDTVGQFNPGRAGGPNSTQGMEGNAGANPWDFILQLEGGMLFAAGVTRKLNQARSNKAHMPFTVDASGVDATMANAEVASARGEIWLPLWDRPARLTEIRALLSEGRAEVGRQRASSGLDLARAIAGLGIDRGIAAFSRMGFLNRNGKAFLVTPLGQYPVHHQPLVDRLRELDGWHQSFTYAAKAKGAPARFIGLLNQLETAMLAFARQAEPRRLADLLAVLGQCFLTMATSLKFAANVYRKQLPGLSSAWLTAADDGTVEFRLARALASVNDTHPATPRSPGIGPLACNLLPVISVGDRLEFLKEAGPSCVRGQTRLADLLATALERRLIDSVRLGRPTLPLHSGKPSVYPARPTCPASHADITLFLQGQTDDRRLFDLLHGLLAVRVDSQPATMAGAMDLPRAWCLLKPSFMPYPHQVHGVTIQPEAQAEWVHLLRSSRAPEAVARAARRLRNLGLAPLPHRRNRFAEEDFRVDPGVPGERLAAALLFPMDSRVVERLCRSVLRQPVENDSSR